MLYKALLTLEDNVSDEIGSKRRLWGLDLRLSTKRRVLYSPEWSKRGSRSTGRLGRMRELGTFWEKIGN